MKSEIKLKFISAMSESSSFYFCELVNETSQIGGGTMPTEEIENNTLPLLAKCYQQMNYQRNFVKISQQLFQEEKQIKYYLISVR
ncbi:hypothetical protein KHA80_20700 [Anaerobacillus sp. HL2]|nr:hypothetical protein KHA80_20700 [Anaerobacillus sp. HL2]